MPSAASSPSNNGGFSQTSSDFNIGRVHHVGQGKSEQGVSIVSHLDLDGLLEADLPLLLGDLLLLLDRDLLLDRPLLLLLERPLDRERDLLLDRDLPPPPRLSSRTLSLRPSSSRSSLWSRAYSRPRRSANSTRPSPWRGVCTLV